MALSPAVSVVLPVRNGAAFIGAALDSMLAQTWTNYEILVIDDGSQDDTAAILSDYSDADRRVCVFTSRGSGLVDALNFGIEVARGEYIAIMHADDRSNPERLTGQVACLASDPRILGVGTQVRYISENDAAVGISSFPMEPEDVRNVMIRTCCVAHPSMLVRRRALMKAGGYRKQFRYTEDYDLWLRLLDFGELANLRMVGLDYRIHATSATFTGAEHQALEKLASQWLAKSRMNGHAEPTMRPLPINRQTLHNLGIDERTIAWEIRKRWFQAARELQRVGNRDVSRQCLARVGPMRLPDGGVADYADYAWRWLKVFV